MIKRKIALGITVFMVMSNLSVGYKASVLTSNSNMTITSISEVTENNVYKYANTGLTNQDFLFRASNVGSNGLNLNQYIDNVKSLGEATIIIKFKAPTSSSNGLKQSLISFSNSNNGGDYFNLYFNPGEGGAGKSKIGFDCMINNTSSPGGQYFSNKNYNTVGDNVVAISIKDGVGYSISLNNSLEFEVNNTNTKFLKSISGLNTITLGKTITSAGTTNTSTVDIDFVEMYGKKITATKNYGLTKLDYSKIGVLIPQSQMKVTASSFNSNTDNEPGKAIDGLENTIWHNNYTSPNNTSNPHSITLDLGGRYLIDQYTYLPRQDGSNGRFLTGNLEVSKDGGNTFTVVPGSRFTWSNNGVLKVLSFNPVEATNIRLNGVTSQGGFGSAAELNVYGIKKEVAPATVQELVSSNITHKTATLNWKKPVITEEPVAKYNVYNGSVKIGEVLTNETGIYNLNVSALLPSTAYTFNVEAVGVNGLVSSSVGVSFTTLVQPVEIAGINVDSNIEVGSNINISALNPMGIGALQYKYEIYSVENGWTVLKDWTSDLSAQWSSNIVGERTVKISVKDSTNAIASSEKIINIINSSFVLREVTLSDNEWSDIPGLVWSEVNIPFTVNAVTEGNRGEVQYRYQAIVPGRGLELVQDWTTESEILWQADVIGQHTFRVEAKDNTGAITTINKIINIENHNFRFENVVVSGNSNNAINVPYTITTEVVNNKENTQYRYRVFSAATGWVLIQDWTVSNTIIWTPSILGSYEIEIQSKDSTNSVIERKINLEVR